MRDNFKYFLCLLFVAFLTAFIPVWGCVGAIDAQATELTYDMETNNICITVGDTVFNVALADNSSARALLALLKKGPLTLHMEDYARMEKVGELPEALPRNDRNIDTHPGDVILYLGKYFVIYYGENSYSLTRLGVITGKPSGESLRKVLGDEAVTITLSL